MENRHGEGKFFVFPESFPCTAKCRFDFPRSGYKVKQVELDRTEWNWHLVYCLPFECTVEISVIMLSSTRR